MRKAARIFIIAYISYLALVLLIVTPALNLLPAWLVKEYSGREFRSEIIWFNPFTLSLEIRKTELPELDGTPFVSLDRATVDLSLASIWSGALVLDELSVAQLYLHVTENRDGSFNFSDMLPPQDPQAQSSEPTEIFAITIDQLDFNSKQIIYTRFVSEKPISAALSEINIQVAGLSTVLEEGKPYTLEASGDKGGILRWQGEVSIPRAYSEGSLSVANIPLSPFWHFAEPWVEFELTDGRLSIGGQYQVNWSESIDYRVDQGEIRLDDIAIRPKTPADLPDTELALDSLKLAAITLDGSARHVAVGSLDLNEVAISTWREGSEISLARMFAVNLPADSGQEPPAPADDSAAASPWTAELGSLRLTNSSLRWRSDYTDPAQLQITPLQASATAISWPLAGDTGLNLNLAINGEATVSVNGSLDLGTGTGRLNYELAALPLAWFNPNLPAPLNARLTDGQLQVAGDLTLADFSPGTVGMDGAIIGFAGKITGAEQSLTSWDSVRWQQLVVDLDEHRVELAKLSIDNYFGRIHINKDGSINAQNIWKQEVGEQIEDVQDTLAEGKPWQVSVPLVSITDSEIDFMDESLPIQFRTVIGDVDGNIKDIGNAPGTQTRVDIKGSVDGYAPVSLAGTAEPLRTPVALDLELTFAGVDMALLSPYSGNYAGYAIDAGILNLDLKYAMEENKLQGNNRIVIDQMKLGEKVASDQAVDLPLELALALLTDSKGVIDLEVPVGGNVDDPEFSVGSVVMGALVNLITKAVTSPFTLLAGLVDSEEDLQRLNFKSGSAELQASAKDKLDSLAVALEQRPELKLTISGRLQLQADRERLQKNILQGELVAAGLAEQQLASKGPEWEQAIIERYQAATPGETTLTVREQYLQLAHAVPLPDSDLLALARERAIAVKTYLTNTAGLAADRATIAKPDTAPEKNLYSGVELAIEV